MTEKVKIEMSEKDLLIVLAEKFNLSYDTAVIRIHSYAGDQREPAYTNIVIEGVKKTLKP